ncbi:hypothetical protein H2198_008535 [Neophaeococcomyces mojaviensis]|uniref:Uncharacterized protein n=1 Tax=Neophaeococcomyces mojaviensis TaxID=3383035 RepID=A0ACC2ZX07_9EURO|nr:hypothetical protein H2198_008535 [Knufia sp. JES_112]
MAAAPTKRPLANTSNTIARLSGNFENTMARTGGVTPPSTAQGLARNPSLRGRPLRKAPTRPSMGLEEEPDDEESKNASAQLIADLKEQLERAEQASEQYRKQLEILQQRLDESTDQQTAAEERDFAARTRIDQLVAEIKDTVRQRREMEMTFESERNLLVEEKKRSTAREAELQSVVSRLRDTLKTKSLERANAARTGPIVEEDVETPTQQSANHEGFLQMLQEKDATIDTLKLELADIHIKAAEHEHMGDGRLQVLEKQLSDVKMQNARLLEENDSFQMLLGEKTLKGDFMHDAHSESEGMSSLAEELESIGENDEVSIETYKKVEQELKSIKEEKKALNLYIDKIIGRLLQHEGFEHIITGKDEADAPSPPPKPVVKEKPLPLAPAAPISTSLSPGPEAPTAIGGFLSRAKSVVARGAPRGRPTSYIQPAPTANENPQTAPSIPINKGHRRARSDQMNPPQDFGAAAVVQQMNKGSPLRTASGSPMSPVISPLARAQTSYFAPPTRSDTVQAPSQAGTADRSSSANSIASNQSFERQSTEATSAQASIHTRDSNPPVVTAGVMKQHQLRPLRLVNQAAEDDAQRKAANRQSWIGWFNKSSVEANQ